MKDKGLFNKGVFDEYVFYVIIKPVIKYFPPLLLASTASLIGDAYLQHGPIGTLMGADKLADMLAKERSRPSMLGK